MYRNVTLTLLLIFAVVIAIELARPPKPPTMLVEAPLSDTNRAVLELRIPELKLHQVTVQQAIEEIRRKTGIPIAVDWTSLEEIRDRTVDIELHDVAIADALQFLFCLDSFNSYDFPYPQTEFDVVSATLIISRSARVGSRGTFPRAALTLRSYDVRDLLTDSYWGYQSTGGLTKQGESRLSELASFVENSAGLKNWESHPGSHSSHEAAGSAAVWGFAGRLMVFQTAYGHMQVDAFLSRLRANGRHSINMSN